MAVRDYLELLEFVIVGTVYWKLGRKVGFRKEKKVFFRIPSFPGLLSPQGECGDRGFISMGGTGASLPEIARSITVGMVMRWVLLSMT